MEAFLGQKRAATPAEPSAALRAFFEVTSPAGTTAPSQQQGKCKGCGHQITMRSDRISHFAPNKTGAGSWSKYKMYRICSENMAEKNWRFGFQLYGRALPCQGCQDRQLVLDSLSRGSNPVNRHLCPAAPRYTLPRVGWSVGKTVHLVKTPISDRSHVRFYF